MRNRSAGFSGAQQTHSTDDLLQHDSKHFQRHLYHYRKPDGQPLAISSQSHKLTALKSWFSWMVRQQVLAHNPASELQLPREEKRLPRHALSVDEIERVLEVADTHTPLGLRDRTIMEVFQFRMATGIVAHRLSRAGKAHAWLLNAKDGFSISVSYDIDARYREHGLYRLQGAFVSEGSSLEPVCGVGNWRVWS